MNVTGMTGLEPPPHVTDMRAFFQADLVLTDRTGRDWTISPPTLKTGAIIAAGLEWGTAQMDALARPEEALARVVGILTEHIPAPPGVLESAAKALVDAALIATKPEVPEETERLFRENASVPLEVLSLGQATVDAMEEAGVPGTDVQVMGRYAAYVWLYGEDVATTIMRATVGAPEEVEAGKAPASEMTSASGSRTASAPSSGTTSTASPSTRTTTSRTNSGPTTGSGRGKRKRKR